MDKIDIHDSEKNYEDALLKLKKDLSKNNFDLIHDFLEASAIGKTARKNASKKEAGVRARLKNLYLLKSISIHLKKDLDKISEKEMEKLIGDFNSNKIKKATQQKYSEQTKASMKKVYISFLRFHLGETEEYRKLTDWIETKFKKKEVIELNEEQVRSILKKCFTIKQKVLISVLFDSGVRIEEFMNIRIEDVIEVNEGEHFYYKVRVREEFSKTQGRTISLLWKDTTPILREWLEEHEDKDNLEAPLYSSTYDGIRKLLSKLGKRSLNRSVNAHLFRHSSATYYAGKGFDYFLLCKRFGWSIGSTVPNGYIHKSGINEKGMVEKIKNNNLEEIEKRLEGIKQDNKIKEDKINDLRLLVDKVMRHLNVSVDMNKLAIDIIEKIPKKPRKNIAIT